MAAEAPAKKVKRFVPSDRKEEFDAETQRALEDIDRCQNEIDKLNEEASEEILVIEIKYNQLRKPFYDRRDQIISNIPNFWVIAIMNHPDLSHMVDDTEENCLHYLTKLEVEEFEDVKSGYIIKFYFEENPYFENTLLTKEFHLMTTATSVPKCISTEIIWKDKGNLTESSSPSKSENISNTPKTPKKRIFEQNKSFLEWLANKNDPFTDDIAEVIKDDLWLNPLQYYLVPDNEPEEQITGADELSSSDDGEQASTSKTDDSINFSGHSVGTRTN